MVRKLVTLISLSLVSSLALGSTLPPIKPGVPGKNRGDIIAPMLDEQIAAWCDFNKQIVVTRTNILCSYVGDKTAPTQAIQAKKPNKKMVQTQPKDLKPTLYEMNEYSDAMDA